MFLTSPASLASDETIYRTIVDSVPQGMWMSDPLGDLRFFNAHALAYMGASSTEVEGRRWLAWIHDEDRERLREAREAAIRRSEGYSVDARLRRHDGAYRWHRFDVTPLQRDGQVVGWVGCALDLDDDRRRDGERERLFDEVARQRALFEAVYAHLPVGITIAEAPSGRMLYFNAEAERLVGHSLRGAESTQDYARYGAEHEDGTPWAPEEYATPHALRGVSTRHRLTRYRRGDGRVVMLSVSTEPVRDAEGRVMWAVATFVDVTAQRESERALAEREERLRAALEASRTGTFRWDIRTNALDWDDNLDRLFGLEPGQTVRSLEGFVAAVHPDDRQLVIDACGRCASTGEDFDEEFRVVWPDGTVRVLHDTGRTYRDATGAPAWMTGACVDVTERRRQEEELRALAETVPLLVWMATPAGRVDYVNSRWTEYTGTTTAQLTGGTWGVVHAQDVPDLQDRWAQAVATGEPFEATFRIRRVDGEYRWFVARARAARDDGGTITRWFGSCTDIHDEVVMRERLERLNAEAEAARAAAQEANRTKGAFLAMMSHDLRTPINATLGYVDLLLMGVRGTLTEAQREDLERLRRSQHALLALVNEVLDYTHLEAAKVSYRVEPVRVAPLVAQVGGIVEVLAHGRGLHFETAPVPDDVTLLGDRDRVQQILLNLLTNATKFTDAGGAVRMSVEALDGRVRVHVADTGRGIPADRLPSVFEPFVQVGRAEHGRPTQGVGLGLAIARGLARGMDGDLTASSVVGEGSTFTLELPGG